MSTNKNALLINYYWPPCGGSGVHRWLRFSKYFQENDWNLTVYCPKDAAWTTIDEKLIDQIPPEVKVIRRSIFEPQRYLSNNINPSGHAGLARKKKSIIQDLIIWIRGNMFIPDARVFWIKPSVRFLSKYLKQHPEISIIISTGPPQSMHLIGLKLKRIFPNIKWVADFRDPWTQIDFYQELLPGKWADNRQHKLEKECLTEADEIVTISDACATGLQDLVDRPIHVITNGYDFPEFDEIEVTLDQKFTISHFGSMPFSRNPEVLWKALNELINTNKDFCKNINIQLVGSVDLQVFEQIKKYNLKSYVTHIQSVPHDKSISMQRSSQVLLLVGNNTGNVKGILTGKVFEYLGAKRPILTIGQKKSNLEEVIINTNSGIFIDFTEKEKCIETLMHLFEQYKKNELRIHAKNTKIYSSSKLAKKYCNLLDKVKT